MANRDVALGLSGVVVGVLLGAGTIHYSQEASVTRRTEVAAFYNVDTSDTADKKARPISDQVEEDTMRANNNRLLKEKNERERMENESAPEAPHAAPDNNCDTSLNVRARMLLALQTMVPQDVESQLLVEPLKIVLDNIVKDYCGTV